jgi:hypothetical protein
VIVVAPQWERASEGVNIGVSVRVRPVQARRAVRCVSFQSVVPSRWRMQKVVCVEGVEMRAESGVVEVMRW